MAATLGWVYLGLVVAGVVLYRWLRWRGVEAARIGTAFSGALVLLAVSAVTAYADTLLGPAACEFGPAVTADFTFFTFGGDGRLTPDAADLIARCVQAAHRQTAAALVILALSVAVAASATRRGWRSLRTVV